jgi:serine protease
MSSTSPGNTLSTAKSINILSESSIFTDRVDSLQKQDFYQFSLNSRSSFNLTLDGLSADADVQLIKDGNGNGVVDSGEVIKSSVLGGSSSEAITIGSADANGLTDLDSGTYYIQVYAYSTAETNYTLTVSAKSNQPIPTSASSSTFWQKGTLLADKLTYSGNNQTTFVSGNGNAEFGSGKPDILNLESAGIYSNQVSFNFATATGGGFIANPGNGIRLLDEIKINNGNQILFEGIERIEFVDISYDLTQQVPGNTITPVVVPNDPAFGQQWNLHVTGVHDAWRFTVGNNNVLIGIEDSGLGTNSQGSTHPDLRYTYFAGNNYLDESPTTSHGTLVQSTIAAAGNNQQGIAGINWASDTYMIDVLGGNAGDYDLVSATKGIIDLATKQGKRLVINFSLVGGSSAALEDVIARNQDRVLFVFAAGNDNVEGISSPGSFAKSYSNVISVGSSWGLTDWYGNARTVADRTNYNNWWGSNYASQTDVDAGLKPLTIMAPTEFIAESAVRNSSGTFDFGLDNKFNGTSASTPIITGIASLIWSANSNLSASDIKTIIANTAYDLGDQGYDRYYGYGMINADAAVRTALALARA